MKLNFDLVMCARCNGPIMGPWDHGHSERSQQRVPMNLTRRERLVYLLLCNGMTNKQMAHHLVISQNTVRFHLKGLYSKLGVRSRLQAVALGGGAPIHTALTA